MSEKKVVKIKLLDPVDLIPSVPFQIYFIRGQPLCVTRKNIDFDPAKSMFPEIQFFTENQTTPALSIFHNESRIMGFDTQFTKYTELFIVEL